MSQSEREWAEGVVPLVDWLVSQRSAQDAIEFLQERRQSGDDEIQRRATEGIAYVRREVLDE